MGKALSLYDLFTLGLGLEIGGAALLVRSTFISPQRILVDNALWGSPYYRVVSAARGRTEAFVGFSGLLVGFLVQIAGYAAYLARSGHATYGQERAWAAAVVALLVAPLWFCLGLFVTKVVFRGLLVRVAKQQPNKAPLLEPRADSLVQWGQAAGFPPLDDEAVPDYLCRVFNVKHSLLPRDGGGFVPLSDVAPDSWPEFERA